MTAGRVWFHIILGTYGSWLPGDPRGFKTRNHREHVAGDYKSPPPAGLYLERHAESQDQLQQPSVILTSAWRELVGTTIRDRLIRNGGRVLVIACAPQHLHCQVQLDDGDARQPVGLAKKHATFVAHQAGWQGKLWAVRSTILRIRDEPHQRNTYRYILEHRAERAWVWSELEQD
jgi:hypothetical protein